MRPMGLLARSTLLACLLVTAVAATGCEDEQDPKTWVGKLDTDSKRPAAMRKLREMFESRLSTTRPPNNPADPSVRAFLDAALPAVVAAFNAHPEEVSTRKDAIEILAGGADPRAIPALLAALEYHPGNSDSERIALRAAQALKELHPQNNPQVVARLVAAIDRATGNSGSAPQIRESVIRALGAIGDHSVIERLVQILKRPIDQQEIRTARAAADAIGEINDPRGVEALVYCLYLNVNRANAFPHASRALMRLGPDVAVPKLVETMNGQNAEVTLLLRSYATVPGTTPPPAGYQEATAIDVLRNFADVRAAPALLTILGNRQGIMNVRGAAAETLAYTALALPASDPQRTRIFDAIAAVFREGAPGGEDDMAPVVAPALALIGDPRAPGIITQRLGARELQSPGSVAFRLGLLMPLASSARHADVASFDRLAATAQNQLEGLLRENPDATAEIQPVINQLNSIRQVVTVVRDCADGDLACYQAKLTSTDKAVIRKAAYMIAWTGGENPAARAALLGRADNPDPLVRRSLHVAIDALSPHGCGECVTRLQAVMDGEQGQESKSLMHLEAQMLISRLRNRR